MSEQKKRALAKRRPKHQNKFAFKHNKHSKLTEQIQAIPNVLACKHCKEIIAWRKQYRKYKPCKSIRKCNRCNEMTLRVAYHTQCFDCSAKTRTCGKCTKPLSKADVYDGPAELTQKVIDQVLAMSFPKLSAIKTIERLLAKEALTPKELLRLCDKKIDDLPENIRPVFVEIDEQMMMDEINKEDEDEEKMNNNNNNDNDNDVVFT